jgi:hypothetical protein
MKGVVTEHVSDIVSVRVSAWRYTKTQALYICTYTCTLIHLQVHARTHTMPYHTLQAQGEKSCPEIQPSGFDPFQLIIAFLAFLSGMFFDFPSFSIVYGLRYCGILSKPEDLQAEAAMASDEKLPSQLNMKKV